MTNKFVNVECRIKTAFVIRTSCHFIPGFVIPGFVILLFPPAPFSFAVWILLTIIAGNSLFSLIKEEIFSLGKKLLSGEKWFAKQNLLGLPMPY
jgi:hypothetical protein